MSATTRMVLDSARTLIIWVCSISFKWQKFQPLHLLGFAFLISGMFIYNNIIFAPLIKKFLKSYRLSLHKIILPLNIWKLLAYVKLRPMYASEVPTISHIAGGRKTSGLNCWLPATKAFALNFPATASACDEAVRLLVMKYIMWKTKKHKLSPKNMHTA